MSIYIDKVSRMEKTMHAGSIGKIVNFGDFQSENQYQMHCKSVRYKYELR